MDRLPSSFILLPVTKPRITAGASVIGIDVYVVGLFGGSLDSARGMFWSSSDSTEDEIDIELSSSPLSWARAFDVFSNLQCSSRRLRRFKTSRRTLFSEISSLPRFVNSSIHCWKYLRLDPRENGILFFFLDRGFRAGSHGFKFFTLWSDSIAANLSSISQAALFRSYGCPDYIGLPSSIDSVRTRIASSQFRVKSRVIKSSH